MSKRREIDPQVHLRRVRINTQIHPRVADHLRRIKSEKTLPNWGFCIDEMFYEIERIRLELASLRLMLPTPHPLMPGRD